jgi:hypothetical protein
LWDSCAQERAYPKRKLGRQLELKGWKTFEQQPPDEEEEPIVKNQQTTIS